MNISFHTGVSGLAAFQEGLSMVANNVANVNTIGYKPINPAFRDLVYTNMDINAEEKLPVGHGSQIVSGNMNYKQGNLQQTDRSLDYAIVGDGFFAVDDMGVTKYTRNGAMGISVEDDTSYLVSSNGSYVLDSEKQKIEIPMTEHQNAGKDTTSEVIDYAALQEKLGIFQFANPYNLTPMNSSCYLQNELSGVAQALTDENRSTVDLLNGSVETSAVDLADEMAAMMITQKAYQFSAKVVQTADELEEIINNLR